MSVIADAARVYSRPESWPNARAELPDQPLDDSPPLPLRPAVVIPELPLDPNDRGREPQNESYRVLSARGFLLGRFSDRDSAMFAFEHWSQAAALITGSAVLQRKGGAK